MPKPLEVSLPSDREVRVVRSFSAPRNLVWDAHTKPELVQRWMLGPPGWSMPVCEMDLRVGGAYRWRWRSDNDGKEFGFFGRFLEVNAPAKLVHEEHYDPGDVGGPMTSEPAIITSVFEGAGDGTVLTVTMRFASKDARDGAVASGMTDGMEMSYAKLDGLMVDAK
jgi:uncharacterized protein YndB with AHSA1/START domain